MYSGLVQSSLSVTLEFLTMKGTFANTGIVLSPSCTYVDKSVLRLPKKQTFFVAARRKG